MLNKLRKKNSIPDSIVFMITVCLSLLSACTNLESRSPNGSEALTYDWSSELVESATISERPDDQWWNAFNDPVLDRIIDDAVTTNLDLALATERIVEARSLARLDIANFNPVVGFSGSVTDQRQSETSVLPVGQIPNFRADNTIYSAGFDASWEVDVFGRKQVVDDIGLLRIQSSEESKRDVLVSLISEVARTYFRLRAAQLEIQAIESNIAFQSELVELTRVKRDFGEASNFDVESTEVLLLDYQARLPEIQGRVRANEIRINILTGQSPASVNDELLRPPAAFINLPIASVGLTSDLLRRRPDVRRAERNFLLAARQADLTKISTYPRFSLFGSAGPETVDIADLFDSRSMAFALGAMLDWTLYDGGRSDNEEKVSESKLKQAELSYRQSVLTALEDVEVSASNYIRANETADKRQALVEARQRLTGIVRQRYDAGTATLIEVLDSERSLGDAVVNQSRANADQAIALIALYKALGGGWELFEPA